MKDNNAYLDLIINACQKITRYNTGHDEVAFLGDELVQSAVIMQLQVIGETARKLDEATKAKIETPWRQIIGLRNVISHNYFALDPRYVWKMANEDIPELEKKLHEFLRKQGTSYLPPFDNTTPLLDE